MAERTIKDEFISWAQSEDMLPATFAAISSDGTIIALEGAGASVEIALPVASISKSIAAQCILAMIERDLLRLETTLSDALGWDGAHAEVTISNLLTNTSGFGPSILEDKEIEDSTADQAKLTTLIAKIAQNSATGRRGMFEYNNDNWFVLEHVALKFLQDDPLSWCRANTAHLKRKHSLGRNTELSELGFAGGLQISAIDLAKFFGELTPQSDWPIVQISNEAQHGPGLFIAGSRDDQTLYHTGGLPTR